MQSSLICVLKLRQHTIGHTVISFVSTKPSVTSRRWGRSHSLRNTTNFQTLTRLFAGEHFIDFLNVKACGPYTSHCA
jgi:hypothetical protein